MSQKQRITYDSELDALVAVAKQLTREVRGGPRCLRTDALGSNGTLFHRCVNWAKGTYL